MAISELQNFYKEQIAIACNAGAGNIYVSTKPVPVNGFLVISPGSESLREIIKYTGTGTDGNGDYVTVANISDRGLGGTTAQAHEVGEPVRMNYTAEHQKEIDDTVEAIVAGGTPDASTTVKGRAKLSVAPAVADDPIAVGTNDPRMNATTGVTADQTAALAGGGDFGTPSASNKFVTEAQQDIFVDDAFGITISRFASVSDLVVFSNDTERSTTSTSFVKLKEIELNENVTRCRVRVEARANDVGGGINYRDVALYVNGTIVGSSQGITSGYTFYSFDITTPLVSGDYIQIYGRRSGTAIPTLLVRNMQICSDTEITTLKGFTILSPLIVLDTLNATSIT
jgi:hypothetical protein